MINFDNFFGWFQNFLCLSKLNFSFIDFKTWFYFWISNLPKCLYVHQVSQILTLYHQVWFNQFGVYVTLNFVFVSFVGKHFLIGLMKIIIIFPFFTIGLYWILELKFTMNSTHFIVNFLLIISASLGPLEQLKISLSNGSSRKVWWPGRSGRLSGGINFWLTCHHTYWGINNPFYESHYFVDAL